MKQSKKSLEMKVYGIRASQVLFEQRPEDIIRAYVTQEALFETKKIIKYCADKKLAYHIVEKEELDSIAKSTHHEGITLLVKTKRPSSLAEMMSKKGSSLVLALEEVENPHNLGAIMRSAAHFGVSGVVYLAKVPVAQTSSAYRTAEGGAEYVTAIQVQDWKELLELVRQNHFEIISTTSHKGESLYSIKFSEKTLVFIGAEGEGLSEKLQNLGKLVQIPGTGNVESLNVSNATTVIMAEWFRQKT